MPQCLDSTLGLDALHTENPMSRRSTRLPMAVIVGLWILAAVGCANPTVTNLVSDALPRPRAKVLIGSVTDRTGSSFEFDIEDELRTKLATSLERQELLASPESVTRGRDFVLHVTISEFRPGDAFKRWLLPGWGATVLNVEGSLVESDDGALVATFQDKRSVAAGGFYTIGAEHTILGTVAEDLADELKVRITKGGVFVATPTSRADVVEAASPPAAPCAVQIVDVVDRRGGTNRIGLRTTLGDVSMGDVYLSRSVSGFVRESLEVELSAAGCRLDSGAAPVQLSCEVEKFAISTDPTILYWDVIADISVTVATVGRAPARREAFSARAVERTYLWPSESICSGVIDRAMADLMGQFRKSKIWE